MNEKANHNHRPPIVPLRHRPPTKSDNANDIQTRFGIRLRELREARNLSQSEISRNCQIDRSYLSDVERGRKSISLPMLEAIALALGISLSELLSGLGPERSTIEEVKIEARRCTCQRCAHQWISIASTVPASCPSCRSRQWNGVKKVGRPAGARDTFNVALPKQGE